MEKILKMAELAGLNERADMHPARAEGRVHFWHGGGIWIGRAQGRTGCHAHHALQIALALDGTCRFRGDTADWLETRGALIRPHQRHEFEASQALVAQLFVEPETLQGRTLVQRVAPAQITQLPEPQRQEMATILRRVQQGAVPAQAMVAAAQQAIAVLAGPLEIRHAVDSRVAKAVRYIRANLVGPVSLADVAAAVALSPGRFRHLFVAETGAAFRAYVLWLRLNRAVEVAMTGQSWTHAAQAAGFADSAHMTRTFKRMIGMNPATLIKA
jgi:AraC family transcriptional regulator